MQPNSVSRAFMQHIMHAHAVLAQDDEMLQSARSICIPKTMFGIQQFRVLCGDVELALSTAHYHCLLRA